MAAGRQTSTAGLILAARADHRLCLVNAPRAAGPPRRAGDVLVDEAERGGRIIKVPPAFGGEAPRCCA